MDRFHQEEDAIKWFESETPHFHKVILPYTLKREKTRFPKSFIHKHGKLLSDKVFLKVPDGKTWQVDIDRSSGHENMVWMCRGWRDFIKYYSIGLNFFVVFRHEGNSKFNVAIFDTTSLEIDYPSNNSIGQTRPSVDANDCEFFSPKIKEEEEERGGDDVYVVLESFPDASQSHKSKAANENKTKPNYSEKISVHQRGDGMEKTSLKRKMHPHCSKHELHGRIEQFSNQACKMTWMLRNRRTESSPRARTLEASSRFASNFPLFQIVFSPVKMKGSLHLPTDFVKNLEERTTKWVTLKVLKRSRSWRVKMWCHIVNSVFKEARFCAGWRDFISQVPLYDRDVCIFKLVNQSDMVFHVFISRGSVLIQY